MPSFFISANFFLLRKILVYISHMEYKENKIDRYAKLFNRAANSASSIRKYKKNCEEFYVNDVEDTRSNFSEGQKRGIDTTYNIPVSTKFAFAIVDQFLSYFTAAKHMPRYLAENESLKPLVETYSKLFNATWYESQGLLQVRNAEKDSLVTGDGYLWVRKANYYKESTTNVVFEYLPWKHVFIDPECTKVHGFEDADYIFIVFPMRRDKAERMFDIDLSKTPITGDGGLMSSEFVDEKDFFAQQNWDSNDDYVFFRLCYEREEVTIYVGDNGEVSTKRPKAITIPNPDKEQLKAIFQEMQASQQMVMQEGQSEAQAFDQMNPAVNEEEFMAQSQMVQESEQKMGALNQERQQYNQDLNTMSQMLAQMPDTITAYEFIVEDYDDKKEDEVIVVKEVTKIKKKRIKCTEIVDSAILDKYYLPSDRYPLINFPFLHQNDVNKIYGMVHLILDLIKAMNKYISMIMYDIAVNGQRKGFIWRTTISEPKQLEESSVPGKYTILDPDPSLPDGGKPYIIEPSPVNQSITFMLEYFKQLIEYITGIFGVIQGDSSQAPSTFGATQSLQNFGTQRIKLYTRNLEQSFENLALVAAQFHQAYTPKDTLLTYFDDNGDQQEILLMSDAEDMQFKVRVELVSTLPTTRQIMTQLIGFIAQTAGDPILSAQYAKLMLKTLDVAEADTIAEEIDMINQMKAELEQAYAQNEELQNKVSILENNMVQKDTAMQTQAAVDSAKINIAKQEQKAIDALQPAEEEPEFEEPYF